MKNIPDIISAILQELLTKLGVEVTVVVILLVLILFAVIIYYLHHSKSNGKSTAGGNHVTSNTGNLAQGTKITNGDFVFGDKNVQVIQQEKKTPAEALEDEVRILLSDIHDVFSKSVCKPNIDHARMQLDRLKSCLSQANDASDISRALDLTVGGLCTGDSGNIHQIRKDLIKASDSYSAVGRLYYDKTYDIANKLNISPNILFKKIWDYLSCDERFAIVLYGASRKAFVLNYGKDDFCGTGFEFYLLIGATDEKKMFDISTVIFRLLFDHATCTKNIILEEHANTISQNRND